MKKGIKVIMALAGVAGGGIAGLYAWRRHLNKKMEKEFMEEIDEEEEDDLDKDLISDEDPDCDDYFSEDDLDDFFDDSDETDEDDFSTLEEVAENPFFGEEKKLRPGEKLFIEEFVGGISATSTIIGDNIRNIDLLARTSNISCRQKCELIKELCSKAADDSDLIIEAANEILKMLHRVYSDEYYEFLHDEFKKAVSEREAARYKEGKYDE